MDDLVACGVNALHPVEPTSMDLAEVKARSGGRLCVLGSVEVDLLARGTAEQIEAMVADHIRRAGPGGGFAIGSSNSVPEYARYGNYIAMLEAADRLGTYPLA
jgi:uroporphyrinogen decarboxylase